MINDNNYNTARTTLINAGSNTANAGHPAHTHGAGSPDHYGQNMLSEARDEFRGLDIGSPNLISGMTQIHYNAIHIAANTMGIQDW